jgi:hypothetical protein
MTPSVITLDHSVISKIVEISNIHGMSIKKFKRIMKLLIADFFLSCDFFYVHNIEIGLQSHEEFKKNLLSKVTDNLTHNF